MKKKKSFLIIGATILIFHLLWFLIDPWHFIIFTAQDIDINSGMIRESVHFYFLQVFGKTINSELYNILANHNYTFLESNWKRVNTMCFFLNYSSHHNYHGAISQVERLKMIIDMSVFESETEYIAAKKIIDKWGNADSYFPANEYLEKLFIIAFKHLSESTNVEINEIEAL